MSDTTRQSLGDRISAAITPDAAKSDQRVAEEQARGKTDKAQAYAQPESEKSYMQKTADAMRDMAEGSNATGMRSGEGAAMTSSSTSPSTHTGDEDKGLYEKAKDVMGLGSASKPT